MIDFLLSNSTAILLGLLGTQTLAQVIVNATPTPRDDEWAGKVYRGIEVIAGIVTSKAKELPPNRQPSPGPAQLTLDLPDINVRL